MVIVYKLCFKSEIIMDFCEQINKIGRIGKYYMYINLKKITSFDDIYYETKNFRKKFFHILKLLYIIK